MFHGQFFDCFSQLEAAWARLFYFSGWESPHIHFCVEHVWTRCPGWSMRKCDKPAVQGQACRQCVSLTYSISNICQHIDNIDSRYFDIICFVLWPALSSSGNSKQKTSENQRFQPWFLSQLWPGSRLQTAPGRSSRTLVARGCSPANAMLCGVRAEWWWSQWLGIIKVLVKDLERS